MTLWTLPPSFNTANGLKFKGNSEALTVLVTPQGTTPHLGDVMPSKFMRSPLPCLHCGALFLPSTSNVKRGFGKYCTTACYHIASRNDDHVDFWKFVQKQDRDECWLWTGGKDSDGYGMFRGRTKSRKAHRISLEIHLGRPLRRGMQVLHSCPSGDNPACVNPEHLREGTGRENMLDKVQRGRGTRGEAVNTNKLTVDQVLEIRRLKKAGAKNIELARAFNVTNTQISFIVNRKSWAWLPDEYQQKVAA